MDAHRWPRIAYELLEPRLRTGDLLLFHGASARSRFIESMTGSEFSHIGMIVRSPRCRQLLLWHTDPHPVSEDVAVRGEHGGAQLNELRAALSVMTRPEYGDAPFVRQLLVDDAPDVEAAAIQCIAELDKTAFPSLVEIIKQRLLGEFGISTSKKTLYCAETVVLAYQKMGLLPSEPPPNAYAPRDFSEQHMHLGLLRGARLGPQMEVLWSEVASGTTVARGG